MKHRELAEFHNTHMFVIIQTDCRLLYRFDSSVGRGEFFTKIGVGQVIKGMSLELS
jgi:hypothetical protein